MRYHLSLLLVLFIFAACEGPVGPEGGVGPAGDPGEDAAFKSLTFTLNPNDFGSTDGGEIWVTSWAVPEVTRRVIDQGAVLGYYDLGGWLPLPLPIGGTTITFVSEIGSVALLVVPPRAISFSELSSILVTGDRVRFVILEPAQSTMMDKIGVDKSDYSAVMRFVKEHPVDSPSNLTHQ